MNQANQNPRRFTREQIREKARDHVAYGWSPRPGTHNREMDWTPEDSVIYREEYDKAKAEMRGVQPDPRVAKLVSEAAEAAEHFSADELEAYAEQLKKQKP